MEQSPARPSPDADWRLPALIAIARSAAGASESPIQPSELLEHVPRSHRAALVGHLHHIYASLGSADAKRKRFGILAVRPCVLVIVTHVFDHPETTSNVGLGVPLRSPRLRPIEMEELPSRLIDPLVRVGAKVVALGLQE